MVGYVAVANKLPKSSDSFRIKPCKRPLLLLIGHATILRIEAAPSRLMMTTVKTMGEVYQDDRIMCDKLMKFELMRSCMTPGISFPGGADM